MSDITHILLIKICEYKNMPSGEILYSDKEDIDNLDIIVENVLANKLRAANIYTIEILAVCDPDYLSLKLQLSQGWTRLALENFIWEARKLTGLKYNNE